MLIINTFTIGMMWFYIAKEKEPPTFKRMNRPEGSMGIMKKELNLSDDQIKQLGQARERNFQDFKKMIDRVNQFKEKLTEELFEEEVDTVTVNSIALEIGSLQAEMEKMRFKDFRDLYLTCTKEQKEKLKPILKEVIGGKSPMLVPGSGPMMQRRDNFPPPPLNDGKHPPFERPNNNQNR